MNNQTKRIIWMADESLGSSDPSLWSSVLELNKQLIDLVGKNEFEHVIIDPRVCWANLVRQIRGQSFTTIIDLSTMFGSALREIFPNATVVEDFHISRVRKIAPGLPTAGHISSLSLEQIRNRKQLLNIGNTLIIDDTSFSGVSSEITMQLWGLNPEQTTHGFLLANTGHFLSPEGNIPGAVVKLEAKGSRVIFGNEIHTPDEDGWHLKDLADHPNIERGLVAGLNRRDREKILVNQSFSADDIMELANNGRMLLRQALSGEGKYAKNPLLWATDGIWEHVDREKVSVHLQEVVGLLQRLQSITGHPDGWKMAQRGFWRETMLLLDSENSETHSHRRRRL